MKHIYSLTIKSDKDIYIKDVLKSIGHILCDNKDYKFHVDYDVDFDKDIEIPF